MVDVFTVIENCVKKSLLNIENWFLSIKRRESHLSGTAWPQPNSLKVIDSQNLAVSICMYEFNILDNFGFYHDKYEEECIVFLQQAQNVNSQFVRRSLTSRDRLNKPIFHVRTLIPIVLVNKVYLIKTRLPIIFITIWRR